MAWLEVADPFCKCLKDGKCSVTGERIDNPYDKCVNTLQSANVSRCFRKGMFASLNADLTYEGGDADE